MELEAGHRRHAEIENAIRDLKYGVGLNHLPSGRFAANGAWLAVQVIAHNLARWTARLGLGEGIVTTRTLRRRYFALAGRLTHFYEGRSFRKADVAASVADAVCGLLRPGPARDVRSRSLCQASDLFECPQRASPRFVVG